jgi:hypothetical protein
MQHLSVSTYTMPYGTGDTQMYGGRQPSGYLDPDGSVWFAGSKGAAHVVLQSAPMSAPPRLILENVTLDGRNLPLSDTVQLPSHMTRLEFHYAPLSLRSQAGLRYQYKLENFDKDWVYAGSALVASYTNLPAGKYRFRVTTFDAGPLSVADVVVRHTQRGGARPFGVGHLPPARAPVEAALSSGT